jgi:secreted trypsin-like serine protease
MRLLCGLTGLLVFISCTGTNDVSVGTPTEFTHDAILGGTINNGDPEVFLLVLTTAQGQAICTGTLIDKRTILTAAHCLDGVTSAFATNATSQSQVVPGVNTYRIVDKRIHPGWNTVTIENDVGVALLDRAPPVTPKQWNTSDITSLGGAALRAAGYGTTGNDMGSGIKRTVDLTIRQTTNRLISLGNGVDKGICHGDSGGPSFHTFQDGVERVIGVHSFTRGEACLDGADSRTDFFRAFIQQWLTDKEAPSCQEDGRCVMGCSTPDIDCVCKADGVCNAQCPDLLKDVDCPPNCISNGVCATEACPVPDVDCRAVGAACGNM